MTVCTHIVLGLGDPAPPFRLSQTCGICGSRAIRYRDKYINRAVRKFGAPLGRSESGRGAPMIWQPNAELKRLIHGCRSD